jgi:Helix-turn-helix family
MSTPAEPGPGSPHVVTDEPVVDDAAPPFAQTAEDADKARRLHAGIEPIAGSVYFAPEVHQAFQAAGFGPPAEAEGCLPLGDLPAYYCSRAGCIGQVPGEVVVAAFGVFSPDLIIPNVEQGWRTADRDTVLRVRLAGQRAALEHVLGTSPGVDRATELLLRAGDACSAGGRFLYAGLRSLPLPEPGWGRLWRAADIVREYRGDSHITAWVAAGLDPVEAGLMTEVFYGMPTKHYHSGRGWRPSQLDAGLARLRRRGWINGDPVAFTPAGRAVREWIEASTNAQQQPVLDALGDEYDELLGLLRPWAGAIVSANYYPSDIRQLPPQWGQLPD